MSRRPSDAAAAGHGVAAGVQPVGSRPGRRVLGWDVGGAHLKAVLWQHGVPCAAQQWPCALWQGLDHLDHALAQACTWLAAQGVTLPDPSTAQAVTMTGEMVDLFSDRAQGVTALVQVLGERLGPGTRWYAGDAGWLDAAGATAQWAAVASANWHATAAWLARALAAPAATGLAGPDGAALLVDIGSTTTDLIAVRAGRVLGSSRSDADRLHSGELVYLGVARTALMALAPRIAFDGRPCNVMAEHFATSADVFRLLGELDPAHDQHPSADGGAKDIAATCRRLARMVGRDAADASLAAWQALAGSWRATLLERLRDNAQAVRAAAGLAADAPLVAAGCGAFLVPPLARLMQGRAIDLAQVLPRDTPADASGWLAVCAPALAVAALAAAA
jgi:probable H4MPT-linked C1 transfer pathway protein